MAADTTEEAAQTADTTGSDDPTRTVDARTINGEPFSDIMSALTDLPEDGTVLLINSFEPKPLYSVLKRKGFEYETTQATDDEWRVLISKA
ncbi:MAG: DUF2249 domain-containing protein [Euryarchaeota archaeon]|nr:DUF2249 domain-containing protein [Euryarchaeota archaeon]